MQTIFDGVIMRTMSITLLYLYKHVHSGETYFSPEVSRAATEYSIRIRRSTCNVFIINCMANIMVDVIKRSIIMRNSSLWFRKYANNEYIIK